VNFSLPRRQGNRSARKLTLKANK